MTVARVSITYFWFFFAVAMGQSLITTRFIDPFTTAATVTATTPRTEDTMTQTISDVFGGTRTLTARLDSNPSNSMTTIICSIADGVLTVVMGVDVTGTCTLSYVSPMPVDGSSLGVQCYSFFLSSPIRSTISFNVPGGFAVTSASPEGFRFCPQLPQQVTLESLSNLDFSFFTSNALPSTMTRTYTIETLCATTGMVCEHSFWVNGMPVTSVRGGQRVTVQLSCIDITGLSDVEFIIPTSIGRVDASSRMCETGKVDMMDTRNGLVVASTYEGICSFDFVASFLGPTAAELKADITYSSLQTSGSIHSISGRPPLCMWYRRTNAIYSFAM